MNWFDEHDIRCYHGGTTVIEFYEDQLRARREQYPWDLVGRYPKVAAELEEKGYCVLRQAFDRDKLAWLRQEAMVALQNERLLKKNDANMKMVSNPLLNLPMAFEIAFDDLLIDVAVSYFGCVPGVGTVNMRESYVNDLPPVETMLFHCDKNAHRFLKFFFYLNDVDVDGGPFTYVEGSNKLKFEGWSDKYRWSHEEIVARYGEERIKYLTGRVGDVVIANTTGFHRGAKPTRHERLMYTVDYGVHVEQGSGDKRFHIREEDYRSLPRHKKPVADFLVKVSDDKVSNSNQALQEHVKHITWL